MWRHDRKRNRPRRKHRTRHRPFRGIFTIVHCEQLDRSTTPSDPATDKRDDKAKTLKPIDVEPVAPLPIRSRPRRDLGRCFMVGLRSAVHWSSVE